jgi:hypothetical protein
MASEAGVNPHKSFAIASYGGEERTNSLRFLRGRLQQQFRVYEVKDGTETAKLEWRDVPEATIDES